MTIEDVLLTDLSHTDGDLSWAAGGDYRTVTLEENVKQAVFNRLITIPGTLLHRPEYGVGIPQFLGEPLSLQRKREMARAIKQNLERDLRIEEVTSVAFQEESTPGMVTVEVSYRIVGVGTVTSTFEGIGA